MKYLFIVQGEGRGHLTQSISLAEILRKHGHEVTEVLVGKSKTRDIPRFFTQKIGTDVKIFDTPFLYYTKNGRRVSIPRTVLGNAWPWQLKKYGDAIELIHRRIVARQPDVVVTFFEPLSCLAAMRFNEPEVAYINIAHQFLLQHPDFKPARGNSADLLFLRVHASACNLGATKTLALSQYQLKNLIRSRIAVVPPLLRSEVLELEPSNEGHILGYMLNDIFAEQVKKWHGENPEVKLHFFWDKKDAPEELVIDKTLTFHRLNDKKFLRYMASCDAYVTTAGFESICEALYLGKKIMMIPAHLEQEVNAADTLANFGGVVSNDFNLSKLLDYMEENPETGVNKEFVEWVNSAEEVFIRQLTTLT